ncbi:MAG: ROK family transcriptional regulator [Pyrinomonadaceae bacterium]
MDNGQLYQSELLGASRTPSNTSRKGNQLLRLIRAAQPITRTEIAERLSIDKSTVTENVKPLIAQGIIREESLAAEGLKRRSRVLSFADDDTYFIGVNLGVRRSQVGMTTLRGEVTDETDFETPKTASYALRLAREQVDILVRKNANKRLGVIGVSVAGMVDPQREKLIFAPNLDWKNIDVAKALRVHEGTRVVVENDSTAAAMYEARLKIRNSEDGLMTNFILVRSGTGIGVGLVIGSEVYRGTGAGRGIAGEFGHMTIVANGKPCVCGNRGCWEKYGSAGAASSLYMGDRPAGPGEVAPRFVEIVSKAEVGDVRSKKTLERIGDYLGIGIANVIMGIGIPRVIISGRLVYGWKFIEEPLNAAIRRSIIGKIDGWSVEAGEPVGSAIGGALEVAVEDYLSML